MNSGYPKMNYGYPKINTKTSPPSFAIHNWFISQNILKDILKWIMDIQK